MNGPNNIPHPIPYQGSKRQIASIILSYFPPRADRLVEPFAGSVAISLAVAYRAMADRFWINDAHGPLMDLWRAIINRPDKLADEYEQLWKAQLGRERQYFDKVRDSFNESHTPDCFLYLLARCVKAVIRYNADGQFNNTPDNRRKGARPVEMRKRILGASELLRGQTDITAWDYKKVLEKCKETDLVYMDPPYQGVCRKRDQRYATTIDHADFCDQLAKLNERQLMYVVSYDGRTGSKTYGPPLPQSLKLIQLEIRAGRSSQATLLGRSDITYESLYLSAALAKAMNYDKNSKPKQQMLFT